MKPALILLFLVSSILFCADLAAQDARTYHYQFIRASNKEPSNTVARPISRHLKSQLASVFRWRNFMQLADGDCALYEDETATIELPEGGELQLHRNGEKLDVRLYRNGRRCAGTGRSQAIVGRFIISAGDQGGSDCWIILLEPEKHKTSPIGTGSRK